MKADWGTRNVASVGQTLAGGLRRGVWDQEKKRSAEEERLVDGEAAHNGALLSVDWFAGAVHVTESPAAS